jgi:RimJ/RimL family protein N-acetyltransferase
MKAHLDFAKALEPKVKKAQLHVFENNEIITKVHQRSGFVISKRFVSNNEEILNYLPYNVKLLMERSLIDY